MHHPKVSTEDNHNWHSAFSSTFEFLFPLTHHVSHTSWPQRSTQPLQFARTVSASQCTSCKQGAKQASAFRIWEKSWLRSQKECLNQLQNIIHAANSHASTFWTAILFICNTWFYLNCLSPYSSITGEDWHTLNIKADYLEAEVGND